MSLDLDSKSRFLSDRYYLNDLIAQTKHSRIYLARDLAFKNRQCVVKQLRPNYYPVQKKQAIELAFRQEAEILKKLKGKHPQICQYHHNFVDFGYSYLVQEWIDGISLEKQLRQQKRLSAHETKNILLDLLSAIECIHNLGIIHNDINPSNVVIRSHDQLPVLINFSNAREVATDTPLKEPSYKSDLYSLGWTAVYLLTGKSSPTIDFWHQEKTAFDSQLVAVIERAISNDLTHRFASAKEMRFALQSDAQKLSIRANRTNKIFTNKFLSNLTLWQLCSIAISATILASLNLPRLIPPPDYKSTLNLPESLTIDPAILPNEEEFKPTVLAITNNTLEAVIFVPGTSKNEILQALGEPLWRKKGFWADSVAWSYKNVVAQGISMGYIFDSRTDLLRQVEIAVPATTEFSTIQTALDSFLKEINSTADLTLEIEQGLREVYQRQKDTYSFNAGNLRGIIQRNDRDRIYLGVWEADFH